VISFDAWLIQYGARAPESWYGLVRCILRFVFSGDPSVRWEAKCQIVKWKAQRRC
jgi:hypothetical protein